MNKEEEEILNAFLILNNGGVILYPTDTVWGIGCDATNVKAIDKVYKLKKRIESKSLICLVNDVRMLERYVEEVPDPAYDIVECADSPTTIIYDKPINVADNLIAPDNSLAIRVVKHSFCEKLIRKFKRPIVSTSANISGEKTPLNFSEISSDILEGVDYVVNLHRDHKSANPSSIIKIKNDGSVKIIRS